MVPDSNPANPENASAFHPDNINKALLIMVTRLYDVQMALLGSIDSEAAMYVARVHEEGGLLSPPPAFSGE